MNTPQAKKSGPRGLRGRWHSLNALIREYPSQFWVLVMGSFIDRLGGSLLFPFFSLYITRKFGVGMTEVGIIFLIFSITGLFSSLIGGALTDRIGRKGIIIFSLIASATSALLMGLADTFVLFVVGAGVVGLLAEMGGPAHQAMVADLLPEDKRAQGYGILRVVFNLAVVIGPMIGGLMAARSYMLLFITDAVTSTITALVVYFAIRETRQPKAENEPQESMGQTFRGYFSVLKDSVFAWFLLATLLSVIMYMQMNTSLSVYLRDMFGVSEQRFGYILSLNAAMVVLFQFPITRWISRFRPMMVVVAGTLLYAVGFGMYGFVSIYPLFLVAMVIITIGEMLVSPVMQSIVSNLAPEDMRGRYMAAFGFAWVLPAAIGPLMAGLVMDNYDPRWIWYGAGIIGLLSAVMYYYLEIKAGRSRWAVIDTRLHILEQLEDGKITAEEAAGKLKQVQESEWNRIDRQGEGKKAGQLRVSIQPSGRGMERREFTLPLGLVNTVLNTDCCLAAGLDERFDARRLRVLIASTLETEGGASLETDGGRVEVIRE